MIVVLTYDIPHRRSQDLLFRVKAQGLDTERKIAVVILPFEERKNFIPLHQQRPETTIRVDPTDFAHRLGYEAIRIERDDLYDVLMSLGPECVLLGGAGILHKQVTDRFTVINVHPGWLPTYRGLDALKWAIYEDTVLGVTTHIIDENVDAGILIEWRDVPLYCTDSFGSIAWRVCEMETEMLVAAVGNVKVAKELNYKLSVGKPVRRRMPHTLETAMMEKLRLRLLDCLPKQEGD